MIRYRMLTDAELAERDDPERRHKALMKRLLADPVIAAEARKPMSPVKRSALKRQHHDRQKDPPPRKIAKRHAAPPTRKP